MQMLLRLVRPTFKANAALRLKGVRSVSRKDQLPSESEKQRMQVTKWLSLRLDNFQNKLFTAGQTINDLTGYSSIDQIKKQISENEKKLDICRDDVRTAKEAYAEAISQRSNSQREVNELLQRKHNWTSEDLQRFTELYKSDHSNQLAEEMAERTLEAKESEFETRRVEISKLISSRYHEEQIWSDKIRRASTWGTWGLMGFNILLFVVVQLGLEPWKRRRLVGSFEEKVKSALDEARMAEEESLVTLQEEFERLVGKPAESSHDEIHWRSFGTRLLTSFEHSGTLETNAQEIFSVLGVSAILGISLGALLTLALR